MTNKAKCTLLIFTITFVVFANISNIVAVQPGIQPDTTIVENETNMSFDYKGNNQEADVVNPEPPSVSDIVGNITSFSNPNDTVYVGDDVIPAELLPGMEWVDIKIELNAIYCIDDKDSGAGDIFVRYIPNYWIGEPIGNGWTNYEDSEGNLYFDTDEYQIDDTDEQWYNLTTPWVLFEGRTVLSTMYLEIFDYDLLADDSLGSILWTYADPYMMEGYWEFQTQFSDGSLGDAAVALNITILDTNNTFTAQDLGELFQPYLVDNDDTDNTADPDILYARVIHGYDKEIEMGALCIQYLYGWQEVWLDGFWSNQMIHNNSFQLVQVYLNLTYTGFPMAYRFVFDNHDEYYDTDTEWRDSMEYSIYELGHEETELLNREVNNSLELRPLLGEKNNATYQFYNLYDFYDYYVECYGGVPTLMLTVETFYHQFSVGNTGGTLLGQYEVGQLNDYVLRILYEMLEDSFTGGIHEVDFGGETQDVPDHAPFAFDVIEVFEIPYIHSNYNYLMQQSAIYQAGNAEAEGGSFSVERSVNVTIDIPIKSSIELPNELIPGETLQGILDTEVLTNEATITIDYYFKIGVEVDLFFFSTSFETEIENSLIIDFSDPIIQMVLNSIGVMDTKSFSADFIDGMLSVDLELTPQILGTILNCSINFHIDEIVKNIFPEFCWLVDLIFEDVSFTINPVITGYLKSDLMMGSESELVYMEATTNSTEFEFIVPAVVENDELILELLNFIYGLNLKINWAVTFEFSRIISYIIENKEYRLGTWPDIDFDLQPLEGALQVARYLEDFNNDRWVLEDTCPDASFTVQEGALYEGDSINFIDTTKWGDPDFIYEWNFGDGSEIVNDGGDISHIYADAGTYGVVLTVEDRDGYISVYNSQITVETQPADPEPTDTDPTTDDGEDSDDDSPSDASDGGIPGYSMGLTAGLSLFCIGYIIYRKKQ